jgi:DNA processing protein
MLGVQSLGPLVPRRVAEEVSEVEPAVGPGAAAVATASAVPRDTEGAAGRWPACAAIGSSSRFSEVAEPGTASPQDPDVERDAWVVLLSVSGLGPVSFAALLAAFGSARGVLLAAAGPDGPGRLLQALSDSSTGHDWLKGGGSGDGVFDMCAVTSPHGTGDRDGAGPSRRRAPSIGADLAAKICDAAGGGSRILDRVLALGLSVVTLEEPAYPERLRLVELPPPLLFVRGAPASLSARSAVAVVGTRRPTDKGRLVAGWIASALARTGAAVVSGLAVGIDGAAHAAVVAEGGTTVAVLGGGHARLFPKAHERLADSIVDSGGAVVSELSPDTNPSRGTFPRRNRLVSGLSDATVVVEAGRRSGALITAGWALEQGRDCFLVPGPFDSPMSAGCHAFLRSFPGQARLVAGVPELIEDLGLCADVVDVETMADARRTEQGAPAGRTPSPTTRGPGRAAVLATLGCVELALADELAGGPATADQLAARTGLTGAAVLSALTLLELRGLARCAYGRYGPSGALASWPGDRPGGRG